MGRAVRTGRGDASLVRPLSESRHTLRPMLGLLVETLFPRSCAGCSGRGWPLCPACDATLVHLEPPGCERCGRPLSHQVEACRDCPPAGLDWCRSGWLYRGPCRTALIGLKFAGHRSLAEAAAIALSEAWAFAPRGDRPWTVTWVPLGRARRRRRGFDQARALARSFARAEGLPAVALLRRSRETTPQARRSGEARRMALAGAFAPASASTRCPDFVLLVDDVLTSGATAAECSAVLKAAGAREVGVLTVARSLNGALPARCYNPRGLHPGSVVAREMSSR